ncbi:FAD dependent oxidoreductase [Poronia punctata]|nr:FAD dependent oxidoreductase [Poronia punctata]
MDSSMPRPRHIVIIGGGIIGATTAYYLTRHSSYNPLIHHITLVEATSIAAGASGKAGGLLGLWAYPMCLAPLSYRLHADLAAEHDGPTRWGYRRLECGQIAATVGDRGSKPKGKSRAKTRRSTSSRANRGSEQKRYSAGTPMPIPEEKEHATLPHEVVEPSFEAETRGQLDEKDWEKLPKQDEAATQLLRKSVLPADLDWIDGDLVEEYDVMGLEGYTETAQVHPYQFTTSIAELARSAGVEIRLDAKVTGIGPGRGMFKAVEYIDRVTGSLRTIQGVTDVVVAAGPWTGSILPQSKVDGLRAHSVIFEADVTPYAVFTNIDLPASWKPSHRQRRIHKGTVDPEIYARPGREVYACGETDPSVPLPETADFVQVDEAQCDDMVAYIGTVSAVLKSAPVTAKQACYMPRHMRRGQDNTPLVGATAVEGIWIAAGHTCWGIQNAPATGKLMSEFIFDGVATSADVAELDPKQFGI